ncbi:MAG: NAD(P)H-dependent oxidoreductase subunit E, partial [Thermodesulfovibrionales bacterium]
MERLKSIDDLKTLRLFLSKETFNPEKDRVRICCGTACMASGSGEVVRVLEEEIAKNGMDLEIVRTGCQGICQKGPVMKVEPHGYFYQKVNKENVRGVIPTTYMASYPVRDLLYRGTFLEKPVEVMEDIPFYKKQLRIALRNNGRIDPAKIYHYIAVGGYGAAEKMFSSMSPEQVLEEVKKANLRGRGGAGFPAGIKWAHSKKARSAIKLVIANGDEGDPGAFMDRSIMEGDPHSLLEGMLICAY